VPVQTGSSSGSLDRAHYDRLQFGTGSTPSNGGSRRSSVDLNVQVNALARYKTAEWFVVVFRHNCVPITRNFVLAMATWTCLPPPLPFPAPFLCQERRKRLFTVHLLPDLADLLNLMRGNEQEEHVISIHVSFLGFLPSIQPSRSPFPSTYRVNRKKAGLSQILNF
jgi:hypothetical protein